MKVEEYLNMQGIRHPRFLVYEKITGLIMDYAYTIQDRNRIIRELKAQGFDMRWDFYAEVIRKANPSGTLFVDRPYYSSNITVRNEIDRMIQRGTL